MRQQWGNASGESQDSTNRQHHTSSTVPLSSAGQASAKPHRQAWTPDAVRQLGMTTDVTTAAQILGIGRTLAFDLLKRDQFPVRVLRIGRRVVVPVPDLLRLLGIAEPNAGN